MFSTSAVHGGQTLRHHFNITTNYCNEIYGISCDTHSQFTVVCYWVKCVWALSRFQKSKYTASLLSSLVRAFQPQCIRAIYLLCTVIESTILMELTRPIMAMAIDEWWTTFGDVKPLFIERFAAVNRFTHICLL